MIRTSALLLSAAFVPTTASAALCVFSGSVPAYVTCIAEQAAQNEDDIAALRGDLAATTAATDANTASIESLMDGATDVLMGYFNAESGTLDDPAHFALPDAWRTEAPFGQDPTDVTVSVTVGDAAPVDALLRYGSGSYSSTCADPWTGTYGRICIQDTTAPFYSGYINSNVDTCSRSDQRWNATNCSLSTRSFSLLVR